MPIDPITWAAIISGGSALIGTGANAAATGSQNRKSRAFSREMYARQLQDNRDFWNMQNAYNHPAAQKQRLKDAGLNPALLYGGSAAGASGVASSAPNVPSALRPEFNTPDFSGIGEAGRGVTSAILARYDANIKLKQVENLEKQNDLLSEQIKNAQADQRRKEFDLNLDMETRPTSVATRNAHLEKLRADLRFTLDSNDRAAIQTATNVYTAVENVLTQRVGRLYTTELMENAKVQRQIMQAELKLKQSGMSFNDPLWARQLMQMFGSELLPAIKNAIESLGNMELSIFPRKPKSKPPRKNGGNTW